MYNAAIGYGHENRRMFRNKSRKYRHELQEHTVTCRGYKRKKGFLYQINVEQYSGLMTKVNTAVKEDTGNQELNVEDTTEKVITQ